MKLNLLTDECIDYRIIEYLRKNKYKVISIFEEHRSVSDKEVLEIAKKNNCILLTEDKDFGEWVFSFKETKVSVILLRYHTSMIDEIKKSILNIIDKYKNKLYGKFVVVTVKKVRIRKII
ncbi:MAG: DUF5615 family PIN-like protein [Magnetococcus sp. YQC-3]